LYNYKFVDLDGVIIDSEQRMLERKYELGYKDHSDKQQFEDYFEYTKTHPEEWDYIIKMASSLNDSVEILRELQDKHDNIAILTKIHTLYEMKAKIQDLREHRKIFLPVIFVPPGIDKNEVVSSEGNLLIDDSLNNIIEWQSSGGEGILFREKITEGETNIEETNSLKILVRR